MRKTMVAAVAALSLVACKSQRDQAKEAGQSAQLQAEQKATDAQQKAAEAQQSAADSMEQNKQAQQGSEQGESMAQGQTGQQEPMGQEGQPAQQDQMGQSEQMGQEGMTSSINGTVRSTMGPQIILADPAGGEIVLQTDDATMVTHQGNKVNIDDFDQGTEVRASYKMKGNDKVAVNVEVIKPIQK